MTFDRGNVVNVSYSMERNDVLVTARVMGGYWFSYISIFPLKNWFMLSVCLSSYDARRSLESTREA